VDADSSERPLSHGRAEPGITAHHNGYLQAMLFPALFPALLRAISDERSVIELREPRADGGRRVEISHREPVEGTVTADVSPDGHLTRLEAGQDGVAVIELRVDSWQPPGSELFDPDVEWECPFDE
jgi:hypothetical protein